MRKILHPTALSLLVFLSIFAFLVSTPTAFAITDGVLGVTHISTVRASAAADGSFTNGWKWVFDVTVPTSETVFSMKFADWNNGSSTIPTGNNVHFYSAQSSDAFDENHVVEITADNTYSDAINLDSGKDLNASAAGRQIQVTVEMRIPVGSEAGSYATNYGVQSIPYVDPSAPPSSPLPPVAALSVSPVYSYGAPYGSQVTLTWSSIGATSCTSGGPWSNQGKLFGNELTSTLTVSSLFTFYCTGPGGTSATQVVVVNVATPRSCVLPWQNTPGSSSIIAHDASVTAYHTSSVVSASPTACESASETRTCSDGTLSGSYTNKTCSVVAP